jgi:glycosyltransferase involved in cell wall biosynthesis
MKTRKFCRMMTRLGERVLLYGPDKIDTECAEHIVITTKNDRERWGFGEHFDTVHGSLSWDATSPHFAHANALAAAAIAERAEPTDLLCLSTSAQAPIADINPQLTVAEWGVGYEGVYERDRWFAAYESYAWMHHVAGLKGWRCPRPFDRVIPNFFDPGDFHLAGKSDYLLFIGRVIQNKGPHIACEIAKRAGRELVIAGPGGTEPSEGRLVCGDTGLVVQGPIQYVGEVGPRERAELMAEAAAVIVPTVYLEPFGGVAVEAMLSGTPVVASDWGAFSETVTPEVGARFRTLAEAEVALEYALTLSPTDIRENAIARFSLDTVGPRYLDWFDALDSLWRQGWYEPRPQPLAA